MYSYFFVINNVVSYILYVCLNVGLHANLWYISDNIACLHHLKETPQFPLFNFYRRTGIKLQTSNEVFKISRSPADDNFLQKSNLHIGACQISAKCRGNGDHIAQTNSGKLLNWAPCLSSFRDKFPAGDFRQMKIFGWRISDNLTYDTSQLTWQGSYEVCRCLVGMRA